MSHHLQQQHFFWCAVVIMGKLDQSLCIAQPQLPANQVMQPQLVTLAYGVVGVCQRQAEVVRNALLVEGKVIVPPKPSTSFRSMPMRSSGGTGASAAWPHVRWRSAGYIFEYGPVGLLEGLVTGYQPKIIDGLNYGQEKALTPMIVASLKLPPSGGFKPMLILVPPFQSSPVVFHLAFEHRF